MEEQCPHDLSDLFLKQTVITDYKIEKIQKEKSAVHVDWAESYYDDMLASFVYCGRCGTRLDYMVVN